MAKSKLKKKNRASRRRTNDRQRRTPANRVPPPTEAAMEPTVESDHEDGGNRDNDSDSETASQKELYFSPLNPVSTDRQKVLRWRLPLRSNTARGFLYLFKSAWSILKTTVDDFVRYLLPRPFHRAMFGPAEKAQLSSFVRQAKVKPYINILCHEIVEWGAREYILQAWVWRVLYDNLFSLDCSDKWRDGPWAAFGIQLQDMKDRVQHVDNEFTSTFFSWRQFSVDILHMHHGYHTDPERLKTILRQNFGAFIAARNPSKRIVKEKMDLLVDRAIMMDLGFLSTRLDVRVEMEDLNTGMLSGFGFDKDCPWTEVDRGYTHVTRGPDHGRTVDFIRYPLVRCYGENRGWSGLDDHVALFTMGIVKNYHVETVLSRMQVVVGEEFEVLSSLRYRRNYDSQSEDSEDDEDSQQSDDKDSDDEDDENVNKDQNENDSQYNNDSQYDDNSKHDNDGQKSEDNQDANSQYSEQRSRDDSCGNDLQEDRNKHTSAHGQTVDDERVNDASLKWKLRMRKRQDYSNSGAPQWKRSKPDVEGKARGGGRTQAIRA